MKELSTSPQIMTRVVSQVSLEVAGSNIFRDLQKRVMKWAFAPDRNLKGIPDGAWDGEDFEIDAENSERAEATNIDNPRYWAFRFRERLKDSNRIWTTEVGIAEISSTEVVFGCRLLCTQRGNTEIIPRSIPQFVRSIAFTKDAFLDGHETSADPWLIKTENDVDELVDFMSSLRRKHPIVVFSTPEHSNISAETILPVRLFIRRTAGYVHTAVVTSDASYMLTDRIGVEFSVFNQAVRTYNPGFNPENDLWSDHPIAKADNIRSWETDGPNTFIDFLIHQTLRLTRPRNLLEEEQPPFHKVKLLAAQLKRERAQKLGQSETEQMALLNKELEASKNEANESFELAISAENEKEQTESELRQLKSSYFSLQARVSDLQTKLAKRVDTSEITPSTLEDIQDWSAKHLSGDVELHERAIKAAVSSDFSDAKFVYDTLLVLRDYYVPMRRKGGVDQKKAFEVRLSNFGLVNTKCFAEKGAAKKFGDTYFIQYQGQSRELDWHLKKGISRDERYVFRLYYFWDAETSRLVVGHLPSHLKNNLS